MEELVRSLVLGAVDSWLNSNTPLSLDAQKMLINSWLERNKRLRVSPRPSSANGNSPTGGNGESCQQMSVDPSNIPSSLTQTDPSTGALTWSIVPQRPNSNYAVRLRSILVQAPNNNIGTVIVIPYTQQTAGTQAVPLNSFSGQANAAIPAAPADYSANILFFLLTMSPLYPGSGIDPNQITVMIDYCYISQLPNTLPGLNNIPSYYLPNGIDNAANQPIRMSILISFFSPHDFVRIA